ncbi:putative diguanylate cyclase AdrA [Marinomonas aquimarina]|uniref:diguanylate cyclase n=1 Tax=Marinomonas aquimarina TaxID=295068 RepID=A0A1A8TFZ4_9GAMM|nr:sensor domain-containing diguanylate cyclase [Marinomonas aquimarina]SBS31134.1 putative diguanylate cyclase AdrA [Marinomonas aquimarina]
MKQISLWGLIVVPFALLATLGGATVYLFSTVTVSNVSDNVGLHYVHEIEARVYDRVTELIEPLNTIAQLNRDALVHHPEYLENLDFLAGRFYEQAVSYPYMTFISLATADGRYVNSTRDPFGSSHHIATNYTTEPNSLEAFYYDPVSFVGARIETEPSFKNYNPTTRPFYQDAVVAGDVVWSSIAPYFGYQSLGVGLSAPIYDQDGKLLGVTATSVALVALDKYLQSINLVDSAYVFLAEQNGDLIASSRKVALFNNDNGVSTRLSLSAHSDQVFQRAGERFAPGTQRIAVDGETFLYHVRPVELPYGQTWYVGVLIPESYYKGILTEYSQAMVLIILLIFVSIALAGSLIARFIGRPILLLNDAVNANSLERIREIPQPLSHVREVNSLGEGLQGMAYKLSDVLQNLEQKVAQRTSHLKDENELLLEQSSTDELTGLYNRRGFNLLSEQALRQAAQFDQSFCIVLCDIDHFKRVNDSHGHSVGDQALIGVAQVLQSHFRAHDIVARYGGEEFMLITVNMSKEDILVRLNSVRQSLITQPVLKDLPITLSFGMTHLTPPIEMDLEALVNDVDAKLYQAKNTGRDKIVG